MKIGIMGGTFDPIHNGHLMLGQAAYEAFGLDEVWFLPNGNPPHKESSRIEASAKERVEMTRLAVSGIPYFRVEPMKRKEMRFPVPGRHWSIFAVNIRMIKCFSS